MDRNPFSVGYAARRRVALRKESVDRNAWDILRGTAKAGRSPQGERG